MKLLSVLSCILFFSICSGQNRERLDSLLRAEKNQKGDTFAVKHFLKTSSYYKKLNPDSATFYAWKAFRSAQKLENSPLMAKSRFMSYDAIKASSAPKVLIDTVLALIDYPIIRSNKKILQTCYSEAGITYRKLSNFDKSITFLQEAIRLAHEMNEKEKIFNGYNSLANTYSQIGVIKGSAEDLKRAVLIYDKAYEYLDKNDKLKVSTLINNKAVNFYNMGSIQKDTSKLNMAVKYYNESLRLRIELNDPEQIMNAYDNLGAVYNAFNIVTHDSSYLRLSKSNYEKAIAISRKEFGYVNYSLLSNYGSNLANLGSLTKNKKVMTQAIDYFKEAVDKAYDAGDLFQSSSISLNIAVSYSTIGSSDSAVKYYAQHIYLKDSLLSEENKQIAEELAAKYQSDLKDKENENLKQQAQLREEVISKKSFTIQLMIGASVIMLGLMIIVFISRQKVKRSRALVQEKQLETERQKIMIENKQKEILDSINYAKRIQESLMPTEKFISKILNKK